MCVLDEIDKWSLYEGKHIYLGPLDSQIIVVGIEENEIL